MAEILGTAWLAFTAGCVLVTLAGILMLIFEE